MLFIVLIALIVVVIGLLDIATDDCGACAPVCMPRLAFMKACASDSVPVAMPEWDVCVELNGGAVAFNIGRTSRMLPVAVMTATFPGTDTAVSTFTLTRGSTWTIGSANRTFLFSDAVIVVVATATEPWNGSVSGLGVLLPTPPRPPELVAEEWTSLAASGGSTGRNMDDLEAFLALPAVVDVVGFGATNKLAGSDGDDACDDSDELAIGKLTPELLPTAAPALWWWLLLVLLLLLLLVIMLLLPEANSRGEGTTGRFPPRA